MLCRHQWLQLPFAICILLCSGAQAQPKSCTGAQYRRAENEAVTLRSWDAVYKSYLLYASCDDGAAAEGYSESVARILADHWDSLRQFSRLTKDDKGFRAFVLRHLDATLNMEDVRAIRVNTIRRCPVDLRDICKDLRKNADVAIKEDASVGNKK